MNLTNIIDNNKNQNNNITEPFKHFNLTLLEDVQPYWIAIQLFVGAVTVLGSLVILALYFRVAYHSKGMNSRKYFIALAFGDLQEGLFTSSLAIFVSFGVKVNDPYCLESISLALHTIFVTLFLMVGMSLDRYLAIIHPLRYKALITNNITLTVICTSWICGILIGFLIFYTGHESQHPQTLCFVYTERTSLTFAISCIFVVILPCLLFFLYVYVQVYRVILNAMKSTVSHIDKFKELGKIVIRKNTKSNMETSLGGIKVRDVRSTLILFITILFFLCTYIPGIVLLVLFEVFPEKTSLSGTLAAYVICQLNSMVNPFLYARNVKDAGKIIKSWVKMDCIMKKEQNITMSSISKG